MTPQEFKAWFDGFTEGLEGLPSKKQWARIQARVAEIDNVPTTYPVYIDRYWPRTPIVVNPAPLYPYPYPYGTWITSTSGNTAAGTITVTSMQAGQATLSVNDTAFNSISAMNALGKFDAEALQ